MEEIQKLTQEVHTSNKAYAEYIQSKSIPGEDGSFMCTITEDMILPLQQLVQRKDDAHKALKDYMESNTLKTI